MAPPLLLLAVLLLKVQPSMLRNPELNAMAPPPNDDELPTKMQESMSRETEMAAIAPPNELELLPPVNVRPERDTAPPLMLKTCPVPFASRMIWFPPGPTMSTLLPMTNVLFRSMVPVTAKLIVSPEVATAMASRSDP